MPSTGQNTVAINMAAGVVGELALDGPYRGQPGIIDSDGVTNPNRVGRVFTQVAAADGHATVGGTGPFYGILANPKVFPLFGTAAGGALAPSLDLPQYTEGEFVYDATGIFVTMTGAASIGDEVLYDTTTGAISAQPGTYPASGAQRVAIVTATGVATVTLAPAGMPPIGVGTLLTAADGQTLTVTNILTGTGGNGTYTTVGSTADHAAEAFSISNPALPSGKARVPGFKVVRNNIPSTGLAMIGNIN